MGPTGNHLFFTFSAKMRSFAFPFFLYSSHFMSHSFLYIGNNLKSKIFVGSDHVKCFFWISSGRVGGTMLRTLQRLKKISLDMLID